MEIHQHVADTQKLLFEFKASLNQLIEQILGESGYAFYQTDNQASLHGLEARKAICAHLSDNYWDGSELSHLEKRKENNMGALACSEQTITLAHKLNRAKKEFEIKHVSIRKSILERSGQSQKSATDVFRHQVLGSLGEKLLNVEAVDRRVPIFNHPATRITWLFNTTSASQRKTLADAKLVLNKWMEAAIDERYQELSDELASLDEHPDDTAVAFKSKKPVTSLKFRATSKLGGEQAIHYTDYGRNPVFFLNQNTQPLLRLPPEITGVEKIKRKGRPKIISDDNVTPSLKHWFWYNEPEQ